MYGYGVNILGCVQIKVCRRQKSVYFFLCKNDSKLLVLLDRLKITRSVPRNQRAHKDTIMKPSSALVNESTQSALRDFSCNINVCKLLGPSVINHANTCTFFATPFFSCTSVPQGMLQSLPRFSACLKFNVLFYFFAYRLPFSYQQFPAIWPDRRSNFFCLLISRLNVVIVCLAGCLGL